MVSNKFKLKELEINKYNSLNYHGVKGIFENELFIYGEHKSGKSTTLDAILYALLGPEVTFKPINNIAETRIVLANNEFKLIISRFNNKPHKLEIINIKDSKRELISDRDEINNKLIELLNLDSHFFKIKTKYLLQNSDLRLRNIDSSKLIQLIKIFSFETKNFKTIDEFKEKIELSKETIERFNLKKQDLEKEIKDNNLIKFQSEGYVKDFRELIKLIENKKIEDLFQEKITKEELWNKIGDLTKKKSIIHQKQQKLFKEKNELEEFYEKEMIEIIKKVVNVLICPVCGKETNLSKIKKRYSNNKCPVCEESVSNLDLYENIKKEMKSSKIKVPEINLEIEKLKDESKNIHEEITKLEEINKKNEIYSNSVLVRFVEDNYKNPSYMSNYNELLNKYKQFEKEIVSANKNIERNKKDIQNIIDSIQKERDNIEKCENNIKTLNLEIKNTIIKDFLEILNKYYKKLMSYKAREIIFEKNNFFLETPIPNKKSEIKNIFNFGEIGESEKKCLDLSLMYTFYELDSKYNSTNLAFLIYDEPLDGIYNDINLPKDVHFKSNFYKLIQELNEIQHIILSADKEINENINYPSIRISYQSELLDHIYRENEKEN